MISKDDYIAWKNLDATKQMATELADITRNKIADIINKLRPDVEMDQFWKGYIQGIDAAVSWVPEFPPDEEEDDE